MPKDATPVSKTNPGRFFEDYSVGDVIEHAVPRTVSGGERALYHALYPARHALYSSDEFARACGLPESPLDDLAAFHIVFGKSVPDVSLNAVANLGYAEARWLRPVYAGDTIRSSSEVIGLKQNSSERPGSSMCAPRAGTSTGWPVMEFARWVMVRKRNLDAPAPETVLPDLAPAVGPTCW
jgi:2-methylfumaryl-CoA hydratase